MATIVFGAGRLLALMASTCTVVDWPWLIVDVVMLALAARSAPDTVRMLNWWLPLPGFGSDAFA